MHITDVVYNKYYLPTVINRYLNRKRNKNISFTLLCGNCMGGYIYHQLGVRFQSPTINLMILQPDFYRLVANLDDYLIKDITEITSTNVPKGRVDDVNICFTHYSSFSDAKRKWIERTKRINKDNLYIIATDRDGVTKEDIEKLGGVKCKKLIVFTAKHYDLPYCFQLTEFEREEQVGNILKKTVSGKWYFEKFFDYVGWLNDDDCVAEHFRKGKL